MIRLYHAFANVVRKYVRAWLRVARELGNIISSVRKLGRYYAENAVLSSKVPVQILWEQGGGVSEREQLPRKAVEGIRGG